MYKQIFPLVCVLFLSLCNIACGSDPVTPIDERQNKLHEDPTKAEFILTKGYLARNGQPNAQLFEAAPRLAEFVPTAPAQTYTISISPEKGWAREPQSVEQFVVTNTQQEPNTVYRLNINYYNIKGQLMNQQFIDNGQEKIHQHFFSYFVDRLRISKPELLPHQYVYADEDQQGNYTAATSPLGFAGFLRFTSPKGHYILSVDLMHAPDSKYDKKGKISPFYSPSPSQLGRALWDINIDLPFQIQ